MPKKCKMTEVDFIGSIMFNGERYIVTELKIGEHDAPNGGKFSLTSLTAVRYGRVGEAKKTSPKKRKKGSGE
jgi:hypothetical protein